MVLSILFSFLIATGQAQEQTSDPLEMELYSQPGGVQSPPPKPLKPSKNSVRKKITKPAPSAVQTQQDMANSVLPKPLTNVKASQSNRDFGIWGITLGISIPLQNYIYSTLSLRSIPNTASEGRSDYQTFTSNIYLFTPHFYNIGLLGVHSNTSTAHTVATRGGIYIRLRHSFDTHSFIIAPGYVVGDMQGDSDRLLALMKFGFFRELFSIDGSVHSTHFRKVWSSAMDFSLSTRVYDNFRFLFGWNQSRKTGTPDTDFAYAGIEFRAKF